MEKKIILFLALVDILDISPIFLNHNRKHIYYLKYRTAPFSIMTGREDLEKKTVKPTPLANPGMMGVIYEERISIFNLYHNYPFSLPLIWKFIHIFI